MFLGHARQESRDVDERDQRNVEGIAGTHEPRGLDGRVDVERPGKHGGLLGDDADRPTAKSREADDDVRGPTGLDLEQLAAVDDPADHVVHVIRRGRILGNDRVERGIASIGRIVGVAARRALEVVRGQERQEPSRVFQRRCFVRRCEMRDAAARRVGRRSAQELRVDFLVRHRAHDVGARHEHVARAFGHDREVGHCRRVHGAAGTGAEHHRDLRHDAGGEDVAQEDVGIATEGHDAFLDSRAARIIEADDWQADLHREVHDLADLFRIGLRQRAAEDREVLAEHEDLSAVDATVTRHDAIAKRALVREAELRRAMGHERVELDERFRVEEQLEPLARGQLAHGVLLLDALRSPAKQ